jgi:hypothetical protein
MKKFREILSEVAQPKSDDERAFKDKHIVQTMNHPVGDHKQHTGDVHDDLPKEKSKKHKRPADYNKGEDEIVYENLDIDDKHLETRVDRAHRMNIKKKIYDEANLDPVGKEDDDIDNDGDVDSSDSYLHNRRKAVTSAIRKKFRKESIEIAEKAVSQAQQKAAAIALAVRKGKLPKSKLQGASKDMIDMSVKDLEDFAKTKLGGLPYKMYEDLDEASQKHIDKAMNMINARITKPGQPPRHPSYDDAPEDIKRAALLFAKNLAKTSMKEEADLDEATTDDHWVHINHAGSFHSPKKDKIVGYSKPSKNAPKLKPGANGAMRVGIAKQRGYTVEEVEQIDELDKKTLGSYIKKASERAVANKVVSDRANRRAFDAQSKDDAEKYFDMSDGLEKKYKNRIAGIAKAADKLTKEEAEQIDEVNIIKHGRKFSNVQRFETDKHANDFIEKNPGHGVIHADQGGVYVAHNKNKGKALKESEQLDEISKDLAKSYYRKAAKDIGSRAGSAQGARDAASASRRKARDNYQVTSLGSTKTTDDDRASHNARADTAISNAKKQERKVKNRAIGMSRASARMEEVEQIDEISKDTLGSYVTKASYDVAKHAARFGEQDPKKNPVASFVKAHQRLAGIKKAADKLTKEEVEQIDEVSKGKLKSYMDAARKDMRNRYYNDSDESDKKFSNRSKGIEKALDKRDAKAKVPATESFELAENFKAGAVKLNDGSSVIVKDQDAKLLNQLFADLNADNKKKMMKVAMTDKNGFNEILGFAREAL